jgi:hypothetical protein
MMPTSDNLSLDLVGQATTTYHQLTRLRMMSEAWHWLVLLIIVALVIGYVVTVYRRDSVELRRGTSIALLLLRLTAFAGILFFFLNLERLTEQTLTRNSRVLLLADTSLSMGIRDVDDQSTTGTSRIDQVVQELTGGTLMDELRQQHDVVVYRFDQSNRPFELATFPRFPREGAAVNSGFSEGNFRQQVSAARKAGLVGIGLLSVSLVCLALFFIRRRQAQGQQEPASSWSLLVATVGLIAAVIVLAVGNLRYPDVDFLAMVWLRSAEAPETQGDLASDLEQQADPEVNWSDQLRPQGTKTRLGDAVQFLVNKEQGGPIAGIVVFTDGRNNAGDDLETVIRAVRDSRIPIYPVGLGSDRQVQNVRVVDIEAPTRAFPGDRFTITGYLQASGLEGTSIGVELISRPAGTKPGSANEKVEQQRRIDLGTDGQTQAIEFELEPEDAGKREYTFRATVPAEDNNELDNQRSATVEIIDRRTKVLLFAGGPTREYRFLRNLLYRDREIEVHVLLQTADVGASQESDELLLEFPTLADELFEFDCIVAFDPDWQQLDEIQVQLLDRWVAEKSGGLVVIAGPVFTPEWSRLRRGRDSRIDTIKSLYPVVFYNQGGVTLSLGRFGGEAAWPIDFTREGLNSEFLWLDDDQIGSEQAWASFDGVYGYYKAKDPKPGARVFARFSDPETSMDNELPLYMAGHFYGAGRVFFQASGEMWRLRSIDETYFEQYYTKVIRWVSQGRLLRDSSRGVLLVDKDRCLMGDHVMVQAILNDSQHQPLVDDEVTASLVQPDGQRKPLLLQQVTDGTRQGMYSAQFHALMQGDYRIELEIPESAGQEFLTREVQVRIPALEIENPRRNDPLLQEVAQMSNGEYFIGIDSITTASSETESTLAELVAPQDQETTLPGTPDVDFEEQLMAWLIGLISGVLCLEWLFRRLSRLA